jgi:acylphosphatase
VVGWIRNLDDGGVEAWLEGPPTAVAILSEWCREGPPHARVSAVTMEDRAPEGHVAFNLTG